jgi:hypothetical protein
MALTQRINYSLAASAVNNNILTSQGVEYLGKASLIDVFGAAFLAAANDSVFMTYTQGGDGRVMIPSGSGLNVNAAGPQVAFDQLLNDYPVPAGAHLVLAVTADATAGTHTGRVMIMVKP